ncbi:hypothetical protein TI39_contig82g00001 [Zymoseptoria brevis]|uniref:Uncharacterized protein n=1 Tax=Zymoseptoria brevis TaxID=1047168 RepID=A0A0F4GYS8_9PEZI|nr:hypothetical protein TI39_contig82g00001 [Zymoseptoria brevis]
MEDTWMYSDYQKLGFITHEGDTLRGQAPATSPPMSQLEAQGDKSCLLDELELALDPSSKSAKSASSGAVTKSDGKSDHRYLDPGRRHFSTRTFFSWHRAPPTSSKATIEGPSTCIQCATLLTDPVLSTFSKYTADKHSRLCTPHPSPRAQLPTRQPPDTLAPNMYQRLSVRSEAAVDRIRPAPCLRSF